MLLVNPSLCFLKNLSRINLHVNLALHWPFLSRETGEGSSPLAPSSFFLSKLEVSRCPLPWVDLHSPASFSIEKGYISILFGHVVCWMARETAR